MPSNPRKVFVVHGRNLVIRDHLIAFLRVIGLSPISWNAAVKLTHTGAPYIGQALDAALNEAHVIVILLTGDDEVQISNKRIYGNDLADVPTLIYQPRPNVLFEAGMAFTRLANRTILVDFGKIKPCSDLTGRHRTRLSNQFADRMGFIHSLEDLGCATILPSKEIIRNTGDFSAM